MGRGWLKVLSLRRQANTRDGTISGSCPRFFSRYTHAFWCDSDVLYIGPLVGTRLGNNFSVPRAITKDYWNIVCSQPTRIKTEEMIEPDKLVWESSAAEIIHTFVDHLAGIDDRCVEIDRNSQRLFDFMCVITQWIPYSISEVTLEYSETDLVCWTFGHH